MNVIHIIILPFLLITGVLFQNDSDSEKDITDTDVEVIVSTFDIYFELLPEPIQIEIHDEGWFDDFKNCFQKLISEIELPVIFSDSTETPALPGSITASDDDMLFPGLKSCKEQN